MWTRGVFILIFSVAVGIIAQLVLKKGSFNLPDFSIQNFFPIVKEVLTNYYLIVWILFGGISAFLWMLAISKLGLSFAFPIAQALSIVLIVLLSYLFFAEAISSLRWFGIFLIIIGIFLVTK